MYTFVNEAAADNPNSATNISVTYSPTAGNLLVLAGTTGVQTSMTLSDGGVGNTFVAGPGPLWSPSHQNNQCWYVPNCKGGSTTFTLSFGASSPYNGIYVAEYSGIATASPLLAQAIADANGPGTGTDAISSGLASLGSQPALIWGAAMDNSGNTPWPSAGTGFTARGSLWSSVVGLIQAEDRRATVTGNVAATFTTVNGTDDYVAMMMAFAEAGGPPPTSPVPLQMLLGAGN